MSRLVRRGYGEGAVHWIVTRGFGTPPPPPHEYVVTANTILIERDSERGVLVILYEDDTAEYRRLSLDGGQTWLEAETVSDIDGADLLDITQDSRKGCLAMAIQVAGDGRIVESFDLGKTWVERLT